LKNVSLVEGDGAKLPFPDRSFDLITSNLGINNFDDPPAVFEECGRVAKKGGRLALTSNIRGHMSEFYEVYRRLLQEKGNAEYLERLEANEAHRYSKESICELLEHAGFRVKRAEELPFTMRYLDGTAFFHHWLSKTGFLPGWRKVVAPADEASVFEELEFRLNALALVQGELRLTIVRLFVEATFDHLP
jgi:SAM-dependent methyltransferase